MQGGARTVCPLRSTDRSGAREAKFGEIPTLSRNGKAPHGGKPGRLPCIDDGVLGEGRLVCRHCGRTGSNPLAGDSPEEDCTWGPGCASSGRSDTR